MKRTLTALAAALALWGCAGDDLLPVPAQENPEKDGFSVTVTAGFASDPDSRTAAAGDWEVCPMAGAPSRTALEGFSVPWSQGDRIGLCQVSGSNLSGNASFLFDHTGADKDTFKGTLSSAGTYRGYYPYASGTVSSGVAFTLPATQVQSASGLTSAVYSHDFLYSDPVALGAATSVAQVDFHHAFAVVKFVITMSNYSSTDYIKSISLRDTQGSPFYTQATLGVSGRPTLSGAAAAMTLQAGASGHLMHKDGAVYTGWLVVGHDDSRALGQLQVDVALGDNSTRTIPIGKPSGGVFRAGNLYTVTRSVDLEREFWPDGQSVRLLTHSVGTGIPLVFLGDGYVAADMAKTHKVGTTNVRGKYVSDMMEAMDAFFSVYPISEFKAYFDAWYVVAVSAEEGMSIETPEKTVNTVFKTVWKGSGTNVSGNSATVKSYVRNVASLKSITDNAMSSQPITVIMPINYDVYAGTCSYYLYEMGMSIGMIPKNSRTEQNRCFSTVVVHECCGHGFTKLNDEYVYYQETYPDAATLQTNKANLRISENVDLSADMSQTTWAGFAADPVKYGMVGTYEGARQYALGIWRPEYTSCMNNNILYFNAPSRYAQVRRIMKLSGEDTNYTLAKFMAWDVVPALATAANAPDGFRATDPPFEPLGEPVVLTE